MPARSLLPGCLIAALMALVVAIFVVALFRAQEPEREGAATPKTDAELYRVREGDTLSVIAERTGIAVRRMRELNPGLDPQVLLPGERVRLRPPTARERARRRARRRAREPRKSFYVLKRGDLLSEVAEENGLDLIELLRLNPRIKRPDRVVPGQRIRLRRRRPAESPAAPAGAPEPPSR